MKHIFIAFFSTISVLATGQNCSVCPAGTAVQLTSTFSATAAHQWNCTNGFSSTLRNPIFSPLVDCSCTVTATQNGCIATSTSTIDVCDCSNNPCIAMSYDNGTDCVNFTNTGATISTIVSDVREWKNQNTTFATIPASNQICGCDIREFWDPTPTVTVNGSDFRLNITNLVANRCPGCTAVRHDYTFPIAGYNQLSISGCIQTDDWATISPTTFSNAGSICDVYSQLTTPFGVIVNQYRFTYNGGGLSTSNVNVETIVERKIYKNITAKRTVTYNGGCPSTTCELDLNIPQQPNDPCTNVVAFIRRVNISTPCSGAGMAITVLNGSGTTYQWKYNGSNISGATSANFCLVGQPNGTYCCVVTNGTCVNEVCQIVQPPCTSSVAITLSGTTLTATPSNCTSPFYQWSQFNGSTWVNVGTNSSTYNTNGLAGEYRVIVTCTGCTASSTYIYAPPCTYNVTLSSSTTTLTATGTNCTGNRTWIWDRWNGTVWVQVQNTTNTSTTNNYTPTQSGLFRISSTCLATNCFDQEQISFNVANPCTGFSTIITGTFTGLCVAQSYTYSTTQTGGTSPFAKTWFLNGVQSGTSNTYTFTPSVSGTNTLSCTVVDANGCSYTDTKTLSSQVCCGVTLAISPASVSKCTNESQTFTATPTGGSSPYTYVWTSTPSGGNPTNQGSGNTKTLSFATASTYAINCVVTDNTGCTSSATSTMTVTTCTNCVCTPSLTLNGSCQLVASYAGAGCGNFSYQLQYSVTGSGWTSVQSGTAGAGFTYTPTTNGQYRLVIFAANCTAQESNIVTVSCYVATCINSPTLTFNGTISTVCGQVPITISNNTFGGSTNQVTMFSTGGGGIVSPGTITTSPFTWTYTPVAADIGNTVTITGLTNNPLGSPCQAVTRQYFLSYVALPTVNITSPNTNMCVGTNRTLTGTPTGGTFTASANGSIVNNVLTANTAGSITVTYTATSNGCSSSTTQSITAVAIPSTPTVSTTCNNGVGAITVTSPTGAGLTYSLDGGAFQSSSSFANVGNGSHTVTVRNADLCQNSTTTSVSCQSCTCTASIAGNQCALTLTQSCSGYTWTWQQSDNGSTGWGMVQSNTSTYQGVNGKYYRVVLSKATCNDVITNVAQVSCPCQGFTMSVTPLTGRVSFGTLNFNGSPLTNYRIEWRKVSDNSVVFQSGMGTGAGYGVYSHPSTSIPLLAGSYYPFIVSSDQGNNLSCFTSFVIANWTCLEPPTYTYNGPGGSASTREFAMNINSTLTHLRIGLFQVQAVPDLLEIIYNGVTLYSTSVYTSNVWIPITYVSGQNTILFRVTNQTPTQNTIWSISNVSCCSGLQTCPTVSDLPTIASVNASVVNCECSVSYILSGLLPTHLCRNCLSDFPIGTGTFCSINSIASNSTCQNDNIAISKNSNTHRKLTFTNSTVYNSAKSFIQSNSQIIVFNFKNQACNSDGNLVQVLFHKAYTTIVFNDVAKTIDLTIQSANPYTNNCISCNYKYWEGYNIALSNFAESISISNMSSMTGMVSFGYTQASTYNEFPTVKTTCTTYPCTTTIERKYRLNLRNSTCPCQSWQLFYDADNNGTYETLVQEAAGWTGTCN